MSQYEVEKFMQNCPQPMTIHSCLADVASELGEVAKEVNIGNLWGREEEFDFRPNAKTELGQLLFTVYQLAEMMGIDADDALDDVLVDFRERYRRQGHTGSSTYISGVAANG